MMKLKRAKQGLIPLRIALSCLGMCLLVFVLGSCRQTTSPNRVSDPVIMPPAGTYAQSQLVSLGTSTPDASIYYSLDGSDPTPVKSLYSNPFVVEPGTLVKAIATKAGLQNSNVVSALFTCNIAPITVSPAPGIYNSDQTVTLSCSTPEVQIRYTIDGSEPNEASALYTTPLLLRDSITLKARAYKTNWIPGSIFSGVYDIRITELLGSCETPGTAYDVTLAGNYAYVADWNGGLQVIDFSDPFNPVIKSSCPIPSFARGIAVSGSYAYVAAWYSGLQIIDISNPLNPFIVGACDTPGTARSVAVKDNYAYLADGENGLAIINISDPANPSLAGTLNLTTSAKGICIQGNVAYVAGDYLYCIDVSQPAAPSILSNLPTHYLANDVATAGNYAYVANETATLELINIANPTNPSFQAECQLPDAALGIAVNNNYACLANKYAGLQVVQISNTANPQIVRSYNTPGVAYGIALSGNLVCVADGNYGIQFISLE